MTKKRRTPTKKELQEEFHTDLSFEDALRHIAKVPKEDVENAIQASDEQEPPEIEPNNEEYLMQ